MRYLNTAYVRHHRAKIRHRNGALRVTTPDGSQNIPLEAIDAVVVLGGGQLTSQAMDECVRRGVRVAALRRSGAIRFVVGGATGGNVHLRSAQHRASIDEDRSLAIAKSIVAAKLQNCRTVVSRWSRDDPDDDRSRKLGERAESIRQRIARLPEAESGDHVRGIEGDAARVYFRAVRQALAKSRFPFLGRRRRPPRDPTNALLGFCYGLLLTEFIGALESIGLDYQVGFLHRPRSGRPSLALDLVEELRPLTDRFVVSLIRRRQVSRDSFIETPGGACYLSDDGRTNLLRAWEKHKENEFYHRVCDRKVGRWALPSVQATLLARFLRGDLPAYPPFVLA